MQKREGRLHLQEKDLACGADRDVGEKRERSGKEAGEKQEEERTQKQKQTPRPGVA
jgi:hypothetical protein